MTLGDLIKSWNNWKALTDDDTVLEAIFKRETAFKNKVADGRSKTNTFTKKFKLKQIETTSQEQRPAENSNDKTSMKTERMKFPTFSGDIRAYARFKKEFTEIAELSVPSELQRMLTLKNQSLKGDSKKAVENISTLSEIWERLDTKYGNGVDLVRMSGSLH